MNKVILIGNLTRDPELSQTPNGISLCKFAVAVNRPFANANGERETDFFNIVVWRGQAENCSKYLRKGSKVGLTGSINTRTYEQDGVKKYSFDIVADEVEFLSPKDANSGGGEASFSAPKKTSVKNSQPIEDDELPF